ncbi:MAG: hypothetical protein WD512_04845, partial [Candidatus Paceibacterota bacterium]
MNRNNMNFKSKIIIVLLAYSSLLIFTNTACQKLWFCDDEELTMVQTEYNGALKLHGYYYYKKDVGYEMYILYKNGIVINERFSENSLSEIENTYLLNEGYQELQHSTKTTWGLFRITNSTIAAQSWRTSQCKRPVVEYRGEVLTDTSFNINTYIDENGETNTIDESIYY